jgi:hypothetical protein
LSAPPGSAGAFSPLNLSRQFGRAVPDAASHLARCRFGRERRCLADHRPPIVELWHADQRDLILSAVLVASRVSFITIPLSGHISDRIGRLKMYLIGGGNRTVRLPLFWHAGHRPPSDASLGYQLASVIAGGPRRSSRLRCSPPITRGMPLRSVWPAARW